MPDRGPTSLVPTGRRGSPGLPRRSSKRRKSMCHADRFARVSAVGGRPQRGQALFETLLMGGLMSLILLTAVVLARQMDLRATTVYSAHGLTFECSVRPVDCDGTAGIADHLSDEVKARYFGAIDGPIQSRDRLQKAKSGSIDRPFWRRLDGEPLIEDPAQIKFSSVRASFDAGRNVAVQRPIPSVPRSVARFAWEQAGPERFGLDPSGGLLIGEARVLGHFQLPVVERELKGSTEIFDMRARSAQLGDAWTGIPDGSSLRPIEDQVRAGSQLDPGRESALKLAYAPVLALLKVFTAVGLEPLGHAFERMPIDASVLPSDVLVFP